MDHNQCPFCHNAVGATSVYCPSCGELHLLQGKYRITGLLGQGGFGVVYEAQDTYLTRRYAIKVINAKTRTAQEAIKAEANIHAQYARSFSFMPEIYDICELGMRIALVMEFIEGPSLDALLDQQGAWAVADVETFLDTMLGYLGQLHAVGIVHRDIKPANIKVRPDDSYALLDFGISKQQTQGATLTGAKALSLFYSPPEQMKGLPTDARSDFYSLAATAYHLLAGLPPPGADVRETGETTLPLPRQLARGESPTLAKTLQTMMEMDPLNRPSDARTARALLKGELSTIPSGSSAGLATIAIAPPAPSPAPPQPPAPAPHTPPSPPSPSPQAEEQPETPASPPSPSPPPPPAPAPATSPPAPTPAPPPTEPSIPLSDQETIPVPSLQQRREQARAAPPPSSSRTELPPPEPQRRDEPPPEPQRRDEPPPEPPRRRQHVVRPAPPSPRDEPPAPRLPREQRDYAPPARERSYERDYAPPRERSYERDYAPPRERSYERDYAPPRERSYERDYAPPRERSYERDYAPPPPQEQPSEPFFQPFGQWWKKWGIWFWWGLATMVGSGAGLAAALPVGVAVYKALFRLPFVLDQLVILVITGAVVGAVFGSLTGFTQWFVLRRRLRSIGWWLLATSVGVVVGLTVNATVGSDSLVAIGVAFGTVAGMAFGSGLGKRVERFVNSFTGGVIIVLLFAAGGAALAALQTIENVSIEMGGIYGAVTGFALFWLLRGLVAAISSGDE